MIGAPLAFIVPFVGEAVQHLAEVQLGMFTTGDGLQAGQETSIRLVFGAVKVATLILSIILTVRFLDKKVGVPNRKFMEWVRPLNRYDFSSIITLILPIIMPMAIHYWLNSFAIGKYPVALYPILITDSFVVAALAIVIGSSMHELFLRAPMNTSFRPT